MRTLLHFFTANFNLAGLEGLGHLTRQLNMEHAVRIAGAGGADMVGKGETLKLHSLKMSK